MGKIKILSEEVANRIAAGEVIERPASVVKECVENSIDAGATEIIVKILNGGKDFIQIIDNGSGMTEEDAFLAFERHATSKIRSVDDIVHIATMGFRGEALPSIASISHFQLITKTEADVIATELNFSGGKLDSVKKTAANKGTSIIIKNIFFNVPARRKFLKSEPVEYKHILNYMHYQSVLFPQISFILYHNHKEKFNYPATDSIENRMLDIFGTTFKKQKFLYFSNELPIIKISGYLQDIEKQDADIFMDAHYLFVNRRFINDKTVYSAIKSAYEPFLKKYRFFEQGKLPNYIIFIDIVPEEIDVNVHPAKTEIRFRNIGAVYQFVKESIYNCLNNQEQKKYEATRIKVSSVPMATPLTPSEQKIAQNLFQIPEKKQNAEKIELFDVSKNFFNNDIPKLDSEEKIVFKQNDDTKLITKSQNITIHDIEKDIAADKRINSDIGHDFSSVKKSESEITKGWESVKNQNEINNAFNAEHYMILKTLKDDFIQLWQMHNSYIFIQVDDGMVVLDQHAAHERILYEKLLKNIDNKKPNKQKLIFPLVIDLPNYLSENLVQLISDNNETFNNLGFSVKTFSGNSIVVDEIPSELEFWDGGNIFIEILKQLQDELSQTKDFRIASAASVACKAAVKAGEKLTKKEMHELITELFTCEFPFQCPHGRPLIFKMTLTELEKRFKRIL